MSAAAAATNANAQKMMLITHSLHILKQCDFDDQQTNTFLCEEVTPELWADLTDKHLQDLGIKQLGRRLKFLRLFSTADPAPPTGPPPNEPIPLFQPTTTARLVINAAAETEAPAPKKLYSDMASARAAAATAATTTTTIVPILTPIPRPRQRVPSEYERLGVDDVFDENLDPIVGIFVRAGNNTVALPLRAVDALYTQATGRVFDGKAENGMPYTLNHLWADPRFHVTKKHECLYLVRLTESDERYENTVRFYIGGLFKTGVTPQQLRYIYHLLGMSETEFVRPKHKSAPLVAREAVDDTERCIRKSALASLITLNVTNCLEPRRAVARVLGLIK